MVLSELQKGATVEEVKAKTEAHFTINLERTAGNVQ
jgi:acyl CoA:acetate/3-ketoacid CoA transferase beta subunit